MFKSSPLFPLYPCFSSQPLGTNFAHSSLLFPAPLTPCPPTPAPHGPHTVQTSLTHVPNSFNKSTPSLCLLCHRHVQACLLRARNVISFNLFTQLLESAQVTLSPSSLCSGPAICSATVYYLLCCLEQARVACSGCVQAACSREWP